MAIKTDNTRTVRQLLRRWCPVAETHQDADDAECGWIDCGFGRPHKLRLRRMFVCSNCEQGHFTQQDFDAHECFSAY